MVKNPPSNAEDTGSIPSWGTKIPQAAEHLSLHATTTEPAHSRPPALQLEKLPHATTKTGPCTALTKTPLHNKDPVRPKQTNKCTWKNNKIQLSKKINDSYFWAEEMEFSKIYITFCLLVHLFTLYFATPWTVSPRFLCPWNSPGMNTGVGCHFPLQEDLLDPGIEHKSLALQADSLPSEPLWKPILL